MATTTGKTTTGAKTRKPPRPATGRCGLTMRINGQRYEIRPLPAEFGQMKAFRLTKVDGTFHDVSHQVYGCECTCGDWIFRRDGIDEQGCKHIRASKACGLL
jgi:hypothetical protein